MINVEELDHVKVNKRYQIEEKKLDKVIGTVAKAEEREILSRYRKALTDIQNDLLVYENKGLLTADEMLRYNRYSTFEDKIIEEMSILNKDVKKTISDRTMEQYTLKYKGLQDAYSKALGVDIEFARLDKKLVRSILKNPLDRIGWDERLRDNTASLSRTLKQELFSTLTRGLGYEEMAKVIKDKLEIGAGQSLRIARTEGHRVVEQGNLDAMKEAEALGVRQKKRWLATLDQRTRDIHQELDGTTIDTNDSFEDSEGGKGEAPGQMGRAGSDVNCFPAETFIASPSTVEKGYKRYYEGELIKIKTADGVELTATPNHPILTDKGWVSINLLHKGSKVINAPMIHYHIGANPDIKNKPAVIREVFNLVNINGTSQRTSGVVEQFHGDGFDSEVNIVHMEGLLGGEADSTLNQHVGQKRLLRTDLAERLLNPFSPFYQAIDRLRGTTQGFVSLFSKLLSILKRSLGHTQKHGLGPIARGNTKFAQPVTYDLTRDVELFSDSLDRHSAMVKIDEVCKIDRYFFKGHVYNLQTKDNYFVANAIVTYNDKGVKRGLVVHNCRCRLITIIEGFEPTTRVARDTDGKNVMLPYQDYKDWDQG